MNPGVSSYEIPSECGRKSLGVHSRSSSNCKKKTSQNTTHTKKTTKNGRAACISSGLTVGSVLHNSVTRMRRVGVTAKKVRKERTQHVQHQQQDSHKQQQRAGMPVSRDWQIMMMSNTSGNNKKKGAVLHHPTDTQDSQDEQSPNKKANKQTQICNTPKSDTCVSMLCASLCDLPIVKMSKIASAITGGTVAKYRVQGERRHEHSVSYV